VTKADRNKYLLQNKPKQLVRLLVSSFITRGCWPRWPVDVIQMFPVWCSAFVHMATIARMWAELSACVYPHPSLSWARYCCV